MTRKSEEHLSRRERQIMDIIYQLGQASAADVAADMPKPHPSKTTVRTLLRILEEKGHLEHVQDRLTYIYRPRTPRRKAGQSAMQRVLQTFFGGSLEQAVAAHLSDGAELTADELARLADLISKARKKGR